MGQGIMMKEERELASEAVQQQGSTSCRSDDNNLPRIICFCTAKLPRTALCDKPDRANYIISGMPPRKQPRPGGKPSGNKRARKTAPTSADAGEELSKADRLRKRLGLAPDADLTSYGINDSDSSIVSDISVTSSDDSEDSDAAGVPEAGTLDALFAAERREPVAAAAPSTAQIAATAGAAAIGLSNAAIARNFKPAPKLDGKLNVLRAGRDILPEGKIDAPAVAPGGTAQTITNLRRAGGGIAFYFLDARDDPVRHGSVFLFGKVFHDQQRRFMSCALRVEGLTRQAFVLPRPGSSAGDTVKEMIGLARAAGIQSQLSFRPVQRWYGFEEPGVDRGASQFLKLRWSAADPPLGVPDHSSCSGLTHVAKVFGDKRSFLEMLLLKRRVKGPMWLSVATEALRPVGSADLVTWATVELRVQAVAGKAGYKHISPVNESSVPPPPSEPPRLLVASLTLVTAIVETRTPGLRGGKGTVTKANEVFGVSVLVNEGVSPEEAPAETVVKGRYAFLRCPSGAVWPEDLVPAVAAVGAHPPTRCSSEKALLEDLLVLLMQLDADILVGHNFLGFDLDVLLHRMAALQVAGWSRLGRLRLKVMPKLQAGVGGTGQVTWQEKAALAGRLVADSYLLAREYLRESSYRLWALAASQNLTINGKRVTEADAPADLSHQDTLAELRTGHGMAKQLAAADAKAYLALSLIHRLQAIPLTKQLSCLAGNLWSRTFVGSRAERIEYYLMHRFHAAKFICPARGVQVDGPAAAAAGGKAAVGVVKGAGGAAAAAAATGKPLGGGGGGGGDGDADDDGDGGGGDVATAGEMRKRGKAKYAGGMVLEPQRGLYTTWVLLLDFNSLYPSIIQEFNICFTTVSRPTRDLVTDHDPVPQPPGTDRLTCSACAGDGAKLVQTPGLPAACAHRNILPRAIRELVLSRASVKALIKQTPLTNTLRQQQLDIQQKALKLTANSIYGCLGFTHSRFYAQTIAMMVTAKGREALQRTVDLVPRVADSLSVVYGDTDSVMIDTGIPNASDVTPALKLAAELKETVNKTYRNLEIELDGIFKSILLVRKKKYAAISVVNMGVKPAEMSLPTNLKQDVKGLDMVRRDWCPLTGEVCRKVLDFVLSGASPDSVLDDVMQYLERVAESARSGATPLRSFVISKSITRDPKSYADKTALPHVAVALRMQARNVRLSAGDFIPYLICNRVGQAASASPGSGGGGRGGADGDAGDADGDGDADLEFLGEGAAAATSSAAVAANAKKLSARAYHVDEVKEQASLKVDIEWYLAVQIHPPVSRLVEHIPGADSYAIARALSLENSRLVSHGPSNVAANTAAAGGGGGSAAEVAIVSMKARLEDAVREVGVTPLDVACHRCGAPLALRGALHQALTSVALHRLVLGPAAINFAGAKHADISTAPLSSSTGGGGGGAAQIPEQLHANNGAGGGLALTAGGGIL